MGDSGYLPVVLNCVGSCGLCLVGCVCGCGGLRFPTWEVWGGGCRGGDRLGVAAAPGAHSSDRLTRSVESCEFSVCSATEAANCSTSILSNAVKTGSELRCPQTSNCYLQLVQFKSANEGDNTYSVLAGLDAIGFDEGQISTSPCGLSLVLFEKRPRGDIHIGR